jgi:uncharacterized membrane protein
MGWRRRLQLTAIVVVLVAYPALSHYSIATAKTHGWAVALALGPVLSVALVLIWRWAHVVVALLAATATAWLLLHYWSLMETNFSLVYLLQECTLYAVMALSFGQSLRRGRVALCTQLADKLHGPLSPDEVLYTRRVTAAWALFFVLIAATTCALFYFAPLHTWSMFANFCVLPLIGLMFAAEYAVRRRVLPQAQPRGILAAVRVYFASSH